jgi:uncharacterized membrane protein YkoI
MSQFSNRIAALATAVALSAAPALAFAQSNDSTPAKSATDIIQMLEAKDYRQIDEIDRDLDRYDVEATDAAGQRVELTIDANSGEILRSERDED